MQETLKKLGYCMQNNPKVTKCFRLKILQLILHSIIALVTGILTVNKKVQCSAPIAVFLLGVFGTYIAGISLNFFVCFGRSCEYYGTDYCRRPFKLCMNGLGFVYIPLYFVFCVVEFIWYVLGGYWYAMNSNCSDEFSNGYNATVGLLAFYFILLFLYIIAFISFFCYLKFNQIEEPKASENIPNKPAENTAGLPPDNIRGPNINENNDPRNFNQFDQRNPFNQYGPRGEYDPRGQYDPRDPRGQFDPREHYDDPRGQYDPRDPRGPYDNTGNFYDQRDPRGPYDDPRGQNDPRNSQPIDPRDSRFGNDPRNPQPIDPRDSRFGNDPRNSQNNPDYQNERYNMPPNYDENYNPLSNYNKNEDYNRRSAYK